MTTPNNIESVLKENRVFPPSESFSSKAHLKSMEEYKALYKKSIEQPEEFWGEMSSAVHWFKPWDKVLEWDLPNAKWFVGGTTNAAYNCLDRHLTGPRRNKAAIIWEGEPGDSVTYTYQQLHREVSLMANVLKKYGIQKGDRVIIYLPMIPEAAIAMLACARIGAPHSVVFGGFGAEALKERINDSGAKVMITADGGWRRGKIVALKPNADAAADGAPLLEKVLVVKRTKQDVALKEGRDFWWHDERKTVSDNCPAEELDSEHPLYILYTSGSTGKPKGILHTTGGYILNAQLTTKYYFDLKEEDIFFCTADVGWVTGHSYVVYGVLACGGTSLMYEGAPDTPNPDRWWEIIAKYKVDILYTAPTAVRAFIKWGDEWPRKHDLSSLRLLGSVGEPINPEAWIWYYNVIGGGRCPIVDTWWQTETGAHMIAPMPGATPLKPGTATLPFFGVDAAIVDDEGKEVGPNIGGKLVIRKPWPSMLRTIYKDSERYFNTYWAEIPGVYLAGDGARRDEDGYFWIVGRIDDVLNVAGHRLGTSEVESALVSHPAVAEAAAVGRPDELKGQALVVFITLKTGIPPTEALKKELREHVSREIGPIAKPDDIRFAEGLPKTRSGKIMRRVLKDIAAGVKVKGDVTTMEDLNVVAKLSAAADE
ncbi:MAG: acetate--CoA ligase [Candidatus Methylacidiphilales bacterium]|nr:acetate--CoA ligase [Candidatus Methylacidiphilales bacterium]